MLRRVTIPVDQALLRETAEILGTSDPSETVNLALAETVRFAALHRAATEDHAKREGTGQLDASSD